MNVFSSTHEHLCALADHLHRHRNDMLATWRRAVDNDPLMTTASTITRSQFIDHIPAVLDALEHRLCAIDSSERAEALEEEKKSAAEHGLHRWQQGYALPETMREWGHLQLCILQEFEHFAVKNSTIRASVLPIALRELMRLCAEGMTTSATRYALSQQADAVSRVNELTTALAELQSLEQKRAEIWREAAHDLRGSAHVISNVSTALTTKTGLSESSFKSASEILRRGVSSLNGLLAELMDHARLEAGQEKRSLSTFDVGTALKEFCDSMRATAADRNLFLKSEGVQPFLVEGDAVKIQRVVQNLTVNALKVTKEGGVKVTWTEGGSDNRPQWILCVEDTGPGFTPRSASPLERHLKDATNESNAIEERLNSEGQSPEPHNPAPTLPSQSPPGALPSGDGIGLSIVKRLCELLDASLELETSPGRGTTFRVIFPRKY